MARVMIMAGGTGGHVFPALAVANWLRERGVEVSWMGTRRGLESRVVPAAGIPIDWVRVSGLRGKGWAGWLAAPVRLLRALWQALRILQCRRPAVVLGMGGFVTGPGGLASWLLRIPLLIHEQNAVPGLTNRLLAPLAAAVLEGFPGSLRTRRGVDCTGNPVRVEIATLPSPEERFAVRTGPLHLLVIGGSLGAVAINEVVPQAVARLVEDLRPRVWHQAGAPNLEATRAGYQRAGIEARVAPFIDDMAAAYGWADIVLCRAGALTVAELAVAGVGAILVPYPHAVDDHQSANARYLTDAGAACVVPQPVLSIARLADLLADLARAGRRPLLAMAQAARRLARPEAAQLVGQRCLDLGGNAAAADCGGNAGCTASREQERLR